MANKYLAIGISFEHEGFAASRECEVDDPQAVAVSLQQEFGIDFDQILLVANEDDRPTVSRHWSIGRDYDFE